MVEAAEKAGDVLVDITGDASRRPLKRIRHYKTHDKSFDIEKGGLWVDEN